MLGAPAVLPKFGAEEIGIVKSIIPQFSPRIGALIESLQLFEATVRLAEWTRASYLIENSVGTISTYWRKPDYTFDPCDYGGYLKVPSDAYTKKTCLWTGNGFVMPQTKWVKPFEGSKMHRLPATKNRTTIRSATPKGFSQAVFEANCPKILRNDFGIPSSS